MLNNARKFVAEVCGVTPATLTGKSSTSKEPLSVEQIWETKHNEAVANLVNWDKVKDSLSVEQLQAVWSMAFSGSPEEIEAWELIERKSKTPEHRLWIWKRTPISKRAKSLEHIVEMAETSEKLTSKEVQLVLDSFG